MQLAFWPPRLRYELPTLLPEVADDVVQPIGVEELDVVGVVRPPLQVLPEELHPRAEVIVSPELADDYDCLPATPTPGATFVEAAAALLPADCALAYRDYSLSFHDGAAGVKPALDELVTRSAAMNEQLAAISDLQHYGGPSSAPKYFVVATETLPEQRRVERAVRPIVGALIVLGSAAAVVTLALMALAVARELRRTASDQQRWRELAVGRGHRAVVVAVPAILGVSVGAVLGGIVGHVIAPGAVGRVDAVEAAGGGLDVAVIGAAAALWLLSVGLVGAVAYHASGRRHMVSVGPSTTRAVRAVRASLGPPAIIDGVRAAIGPPAAISMVAGSALVGGALIAAVVFSSSLTALVSTPTSYGWPWDAAAMTGFGYGDLDTLRARQLLNTDPDVDDWTMFGFLNDIAVDDQPLMALLASRHRHRSADLQDRP